MGIAYKEGIARPFFTRCLLPMWNLYYNSPRFATVVDYKWSSIPGGARLLWWAGHLDHPQVARRPGVRGHLVRTIHRKRFDRSVQFRAKRAQFCIPCLLPTRAEDVDIHAGNLCGEVSIALALLLLLPIHHTSPTTLTPIADP